MRRQSLAWRGSFCRQIGANQVQPQTIEDSLKCRSLAAAASFPVSPPTHCVCCVCWTWRTVNWIGKLKCLLSLQYILMSFRWQNVVLVINFSSCCLSSPALLRCCRLRGCQIHPPTRAQTPPFHHINFIRTTSTHKQPDRYVHSDGEEAVANRSK